LFTTIRCFVCVGLLDNIKQTAKRTIVKWRTTYCTGNCVKNETVQFIDTVPVHDVVHLSRARGGWHVEWHASTTCGPHGRVRSSHPTRAQSNNTVGRPNQLCRTLDKGTFVRIIIFIVHWNIHNKRLFL